MSFIYPEEVTKLAEVVFGKCPVISSDFEENGFHIEELRSPIGVTYHVLTWESVEALKRMARGNPRASALAHVCPIRFREEYEEYKDVLLGRA